MIGAFFLYNLVASILFLFIAICECSCVCSFFNIYISVLKVRRGKQKYFTFCWESRLITKSNTTFNPFDFYLCICNFYILRVCTFNYGFEIKIKWYDAMKEMENLKK